jgi:hypothetical protein
VPAPAKLTAAAGRRSMPRAMGTAKVSGMPPGAVRPQPAAPVLSLRPQSSSSIGNTS